MTPEQNEAYYLNRLDPFRIRHSKGNWYRARCPIHGGNNQSALQIEMHDGWWNCFVCGEKGPGIFQFEMQMLKLELGFVPEVDVVKASIERIIGTPIERRVYPEPVDPSKKGGWDRAKAREKYVYTDEIGNEVFCVWRFVDSRGNKATPPDHPCGCSLDSDCDKCDNGRVWGAKGVRRVLYRWPDVIQSSLVFVVEGERNVNDLSRALGTYVKKKGGFQFGNLTLDHVGVTTNPGGAMAWKKDYGYGKEFQSKTVIKLGDNDEAGSKHDEDACSDISSYATKVFQLTLPDVGEGEDISDYLQRNSVEDFLKLLATDSLNEYAQPDKKEVTSKSESLSPRTILVKPSLLTPEGGHASDWLVDRLIHRGTRGLVIAPPKTGKSLFFLDIAIALAAQQGILSLRPYCRPVRVGVISREDGAELVSERLQALCRGRSLSFADIDRHLRVNTRSQSARFRIDIDMDLKEMAMWLKLEQIEFCIIDVLNRIHSGQENSSDEMTQVMNKFDELSQLSNTQVCVIHHAGKSGTARGSSSIEGWADYIFKLESDPQDQSMKSLTVRTKSSGEVPTRLMRYEQSADLTTSRIRLVVPR